MDDSSWILIDIMLFISSMSNYMNMSPDFCHHYNSMFIIDNTATMFDDMTDYLKFHSNIPVYMHLCL